MGAETEEKWINYWNELYQLLEGAPTRTIIVVPDYREISLNEAQGWIQSSVYAGHGIDFGSVHWKGEKAITIRLKKE